MTIPNTVVGKKKYYLKDGDNLQTACLAIQEVDPRTAYPNFGDNTFYGEPRKVISFQNLIPSDRRASQMREAASREIEIPYADGPRELTPEIMALELERATETLDRLIEKVTEGYLTPVIAVIEVGNVSCGLNDIHRQNYISLEVKISPYSVTKDSKVI
jgi:hypothetical protein